MSGIPTPRPLPAHPHLDQLRKQAKERLAELRHTDPAATLAGAQRAVAQEYGFASWRRLKAQVDRMRPGGPADLPNPWGEELATALADAARHRDPGAQAAVWREFLARYPDDAELAAAFADHVAGQDPDAALAILDGLAERPTPAILSHRAGLLRRVGRIDDGDYVLQLRAAIAATGPQHERGLALTHYAAFLEQVRGDLAGAEEQYRAAAALDYPQARVAATMQGILAGFLWHQGRATEAEDWFRRSRAASTREDPATLHFAALLTATGRMAEGLALVHEVLGGWWLPTLTDPLPVDLACRFLQFAHGAGPLRAEAGAWLRGTLRAVADADPPRDLHAHLDLRPNARAVLAAGDAFAPLVNALAQILSAAEQPGRERIAAVLAMPGWP